MTPIIFLDIDGVLAASPEGEPALPVFTPRCVEAFKFLLGAVPRARVVLSSTWRLPGHVGRLRAQWREHGLPESLAVAGTPDLRGEPGVSPYQRRGLEIRAWLDCNPQASRWVVLDDERMGVEPVLGADRCVFTSPASGLTFPEAERAAGILASSACRHPSR